MSNFYLSIASALYDSITDGTHDSPKTVSIGKKLITSKHIKGGEIDFATANLISTEDFEFINKRSKVDKWDVIISMIGEYCGFCYIERNDVIDYAIKNVGLFKTGIELEAKWLYYYLNSQAGKQYLKKIRLGSSQPYLSLGGLRSLPILNCDAHLKKSIVKILSSLDSKIELNNRINAELEAMAKTIYDYWFVQFDFPTPSPSGRAGVGLPYKSSGGKMVWNEDLKREIPEGWEVHSLSNLCSLISRGISPKYLEMHGVCVLNQKCIRDNKIDFSFSRRHDYKAKDATKRQIKKYDLLVNSTGVGTLGRVAIVKWIPEDFITVDSHVTIVRANEKLIDQLYFVFSLVHKQKEIEGFSLGSTGQVELSRSQLDSIKVIVPNTKLQNTFRSFYAPTIQKMAICEIENQQLSNLRDWLLPMLMNGQVTVGKVYEQMEGGLGMVAEGDVECKKDLKEKV